MAQAHADCPRLLPHLPAPSIRPFVVVDGVSRAQRHHRCHRGNKETQPTPGCRKKDVVRRILAKHYPPMARAFLCWQPSLVPKTVSGALTFSDASPYCFTATGLEIDGLALCRMFNHAIAGKDPLNVTMDEWGCLRNCRYHMNHQGTDNVLLFPPESLISRQPIPYSVANDWVVHFATTIDRWHNWTNEYFDHAGCGGC